MIRLHMAWTLANNLAGLACDLAAAGCERASLFLHHQANAHYQATKTTQQQRRDRW